MQVTMIMGEVKKSQMFLSGTNGSKRVCMFKSQRKIMLITFFNYKDTVHF
jgi:hypothetical protein